MGVGEFLDLIPMVDLAEKCGMHLLQILPINDTSVYGTWWDSYPYSSISIYALHPLYMSLAALREEMPVEIKVEIDTAQSSLQSPNVLYEGANFSLISREAFYDLRMTFVRPSSSDPD